MCLAKLSQELLARLAKPPAVFKQLPAEHLDRVARPDHQMMDDMADFAVTHPDINRNRKGPDHG